MGENVTGSGGMGSSGGGAGGSTRDRTEDFPRSTQDFSSAGGASSSDVGTSGFGGGTGESGYGSSSLTVDSEQHGRVREAAHELKDRARESGRDLIDQAVEKKDELKARANTMVDDGRHRVADRAGTLVRALHATANNLDDQGDRQLSNWVHQAADQVDRVAGYLNGHDAGGLMRDMEDLARRNPALFLGGTYAAGLVLGRFLRASAPERRDRYHEEPHPTEGELGYGTLEPSAEQHWPGSTSDSGSAGRMPDEAGSSWTGVGVSRDSFAGGHTSGGRTDESLRRGQDLGGTSGYGTSGGLGSSGMGSSGMADPADHDRDREV